MKKIHLFQQKLLLVQDQQQKIMLNSMTSKKVGSKFSKNIVKIENIPENADVFTIFRLSVDDNVLDLMIQQTLHIGVLLETDGYDKDFL